MNINSIGMKISSFFNNVNDGKLVGTSKNGISVYRKVAENGSEIITSYKNGSLFKQLVKDTVEFSNSSLLHPLKVNGHITTVHNYENGTTTYIKNWKTLNPNAQLYGANLNETRELSVNTTKFNKNGREVKLGNEFEYVVDSQSSYIVRTKYDDNGKIVSKTVDFEPKS